MSLQIGEEPPGGFREVLDGLPQAVLVFDSSGLTKFVNAAASDLLVRCGADDPDGDGRDVEELTALPRLGPLARLDGTPIEPEELPWERLARGEAFRHYELRVERWWSPGARPILSFTGRTVRRSATGELLRLLTIDECSHEHQSEILFRTVFERGPVPVTLVRLSDGCVIDANAALLELLGYRRSDVVGRRVPDLAGSLNWDELESARARLERGEEVERLELVVRGADGISRTMLSWHRQVEVNGENCLLGVYLDVTEQKELDRRLREATQQVLQSASIFSRTVMQQLERLRSPDRAPAVSGELDLLTRREREVVTRVGAGHSNLRIADELALTPQTVRNYVTRIYRKIGVGNRAEAVVWARERGLVEG